MGKRKSKGQSKIVQLEEKVADLEHKWKRTLADYDNLCKRAEKDRSDWSKLASASLIDKLLGTLDNLERIEAYLKDKGLALAMKQFRQVLESEWVEEIEVLGKEFDPELMDCTEIVKGQENMVMEVCQKGYRLAGKVIRPVKVKVGKGGK